jgi:hypothetical protein
MYVTSRHRYSGASKAQIGRLVSLQSDGASVGRLICTRLSFARPASIALPTSAPAIFPEAACEIDIAFIRQLINEGDCSAVGGGRHHHRHR